jgi:DNA-binding NarL/FixJ family response regulator
VTDIRMPPTGTDEGIRAAATLRDSHPGVGVVVLSQYDEPEYAVALLTRGAAGRAYLLKDALGDTDDLVRAIREVAAGRSVIDPQVVENLVAARTRFSASPLRALSPREVDVLSAMAQGRSNDAIASTLFISVRVVEKHISAIFAKLGLTEEGDVHRRVKAVLIYLSEGAAP